MWKLRSDKHRLLVEYPPFKNIFLPFLTNSTLGDLEDLLEDFSDFEEEFLLEVAWIDWLDWAKSSRLENSRSLPLPPPPRSHSVSSHLEDTEADRRRARRRFVTSRPIES